MGKYKPYSEYKDSGVEWLGDVPLGWNCTKVKHCTRFQVGWTPPTKNSQNFIGSNVWVNISDMNVSVLTDSAKHISDTAVSEASMQVTPSGSLLFSFKLSVGNVAFAGRDLYTNEAIASFLKDEAGSPLRFLYYALPLYVLQNASENIYGAKILNQELIKNAAICTPPHKDCNTIAAFLDHETVKIDRLIEKQEKLIKLLKEKRQAVISHAVTKGLNPDAPMKDSGVEWLGEVPEHWGVKRLKHIASLQSGIAKGKDLSKVESITVPYLRVANVQDGYVNLEDVAEIDIQPHELERYLLKEGDVLMNEGGDNDKLGRGTVWNGKVAPCIHQNHVFAIRPHAVEPEWLACVTRASSTKFYFFSKSKQSTNLASISATNILETPVTVPPYEERGEILKYLERVSIKLDKLSEVAKAKVDLLKERRTALISAAVTGKIDVRDWNKD